MSSRETGTLPPQQLSSLLKLLPDVQYAFGYGSGVFRQPNLYQAGSQPLVDFIVAVENPGAWHALVRPNCPTPAACLQQAAACAQRRPLNALGLPVQNIKQNRSHYSFLRWLGGGTVSLVIQCISLPLHAWSDLAQCRPAGCLTSSDD